MNKISYLRTSKDGKGRWRMEYHYEDERPSTYHGDFPSEEALDADLSFHGWVRGFGPGGQELWLPPQLPGPMEPVAAHSVDLRGSEELSVFKSFTVVLLFHHTMHPTLGTCWGFSYRLARYSASGVETAVDIMVVDPILSFVTGGLFEVECIGHFLTQQSAQRAGAELYRRVREQLGDELLEFAINLRVRKGVFRGRREDAARAEAG